jgi:serine protease Do
MKQVKHSIGFLVLLIAALIALPGCNAVGLSSVAQLPHALIAQAQAPATAVPTATPIPTATPLPNVPLTADGVLTAIEGRLQEIYARVSPSVVNIQVSKTVAASSVSGFPFGQSTRQGPQVQRGLASGFMWDKNGNIVTNNHVVADATKIIVVFADGTSVSAQIVGTDPDSDLAVIKVDVAAERLHPVQMADSTAVKVGQLAVAIGNPFGLEGTMTVGFVSALGRWLPVDSGDGLGLSYTIPDIIQTDAPINPGNSGGVLVNDQAQVVGVTAAIESPVQANAGIGFVIPSAIVSKVVPILIADGKYEHTWLGLSGTTLSTELNAAMNLPADQLGVLVASVTAGGPADKAGLLGSDRTAEIDGQQVNVGGDVIVAIDGQPVKDFEDLVAYLARSTDVGQTVTLNVLRNGESISVPVTLAARPAAEPQQARQPQNRITGGAWLGIRGMTLTPEMGQAMQLGEDQQGVLVVEVVKGSPAEEAGLLGSDETVTVQGQQVPAGGDVITAIDDEAVSQVEQVVSFMRQAEPGQEVTLTVLRGGESLDLVVKLAEPASNQ